MVDFAHLQRWSKGVPRQRMLAEFLRALAPEAVFNVNSRLMWDMMGTYGRGAVVQYAALCLPFVQ